MATGQCTIKVRYCEAGRTGFAHHANYYNWFDLALEGLFESFGMSYAAYEDMGLRVLPVADGCKYSVPAQYGDELTVTVTVDEVTGIKMRFAYSVERTGDGAHIATGYSENILINERMRPVNIKRTLPDLYAKLTG